MKLVPPTLMQLVWRVQEQALEMATLRAALDEQIKSLAHLQAELGLLPLGRRRRKIRTLRTQTPSHSNHRSHA